MTTQAEHEAAARQAFYTGKGLAAGDMNEQHIIDAFAAALAEAVRVARIKGLNEAHAIAHAAALGWEDESGKSRSGERVASRLIAEAILRRERAEGDATPGESIKERYARMTVPQGQSLGETLEIEGEGDATAKPVPGGLAHSRHCPSFVGGKCLCNLNKSWGEGDATPGPEPTADCGCIYHAEDGTPCEHDLALLGTPPKTGEKETP